MKRIIATLFIAGSLNAVADTLTLQITDVRTDAGKLMIAILGSAAAYDDKAAPSASVILPARIGTVTYTTDALPAGEYAIRVMHDENDNGKLDANFVGIPKEPYGFSNNARGRMGPPKWEAARFSLGADGATQTIQLNH